MKKELEHRDDELIDLGAVTAETHGSNDGILPDGVQPRKQIGIVTD